MKAQGMPEAELARGREELEGAQAWLFLDAEGEPVLFYRVEGPRLRMERLSLSRKLRTFSLSLVNRPDRAKGSCVARDARRITCEVGLERPKPMTLRATLSRAEAPAAPGLPAPGVYAMERAAPGSEAAQKGRQQMLGWLQEKGKLEQAAAEALLSEMDRLPTLVLTHGAWQLVYGPQLSMTEGEAPKVERSALFENRLVPQKNGFVLETHYPHVDRVLRAQCTLGGDGYGCKDEAGNEVVFRRRK